VISTSDRAPAGKFRTSRSERKVACHPSAASARTHFDRKSGLSETTGRDVEAPLPRRPVERARPGECLGQQAAAIEAVGTLIVVDYAESQISLLEQIADAAASSPTKTPIRLLAPARSAEGWWQSTEIDRGVSSVFYPVSIELIEEPLDASERTEFFDKASAAFRDALRAAGLETPAVPPPELAGQAYDRPLT
jgi:hypothetical protein